MIAPARPRWGHVPAEATHNFRDSTTKYLHGWKKLTDGRRLHTSTAWSCQTTPNRQIRAMRPRMRPTVAKREMVWEKAMVKGKGSDWRDSIADAAVRRRLGQDCSRNAGEADWWRDGSVC